ncbi:MAG: hypothetical protein GX216_06905 [Methanomicrobiales archaeon]|nr:hypothetical protein [Methanomicrobiales archaeon]
MSRSARRGESAYLDIEFGYVYGTCREVMMPVEIGAVVHRPEDDTVRFVGEEFRYDVDVEIWKKVTDTCGKTIGVATTVANTGRSEYGRTYDHSFRVSGREILAAGETARSAFADLRSFMDSLLSTRDITRIVVFAAHMERKAFRTAEVSLDGCALVDLQREIRRSFGMKQPFSLDRLAHLIDFSVEGSTITSRNFRYPVPGEYRHLLALHRGMGDAARMFLLAREYQERFPDLEGRIRALMETCG